MTSTAAGGFAGMAERIAAEAERASTDLKRFGAVGRGDLAFAPEHRARFRVMFRADLADEADPTLAEAGGRGHSCRTAWSGSCRRARDPTRRAGARAPPGQPCGVAILAIEGALTEEMATAGTPDLLGALGATLPVFTASPEG